jgi:hypothetical protein
MRFQTDCRQARSRKFGETSANSTDSRNLKSISNEDNQCSLDATSLSRLTKGVVNVMKTSDFGLYRYQNWIKFSVYSKIKREKPEYSRSGRLFS